MAEGGPCPGQEIIEQYDKDKSGKLSKTELRKALEKTGIDPEEIDGYFKEFDADGNNEIDKEEFEERRRILGE